MDSANPEPRDRGVTTVGTSGGSRDAHGAGPADELTVTRAERDLCLVRLHQAEGDRARLRADLAEALDQVEYWRTLAEYRERRLVERPT